MRVPSIRQSWKRALLGIGLVVVGMAAAPGRAEASIKLSLSDGVNPVIVVSDNGVGDVNPGDGIITFTGIIGVWNVNATTGRLESLNPAALDLSSINATSTGSGSLTIKFSGDGFPGPIPGIEGEIGGTLAPSATLTATALINDSNVLFDQVDPEASFTIGPFTTSPFAATGWGDGSIDGPFSMTLLTVLTHNGSGTRSSSYDFFIEAAPEPGALVMWATLLVPGVGGYLARRRAKQTA